MPKVVSQEQVSQVMELVHGEKTTEEIAEQVGLFHRTVYKIIMRECVPSQPDCGVTLEPVRVDPCKESYEIDFPDYIAVSKAADLFPRGCMEPMARIDAIASAAHRSREMTLKVLGLINHPLYRRGCPPKSI